MNNACKVYVSGDILSCHLTQELGRKSALEYCMMWHEGQGHVNSNVATVILGLVYELYKIDKVIFKVPSLPSLTERVGGSVTLLNCSTDVAEPCGPARQSEWKLG